MPLIYMQPVNKALTCILPQCLNAWLKVRQQAIAAMCVCVYISSIFFNTVYQNKIIDFKAESHTLSEKTSGSFVSQVLIKYLLCDDPCVRHWDNCKIMVYSKLKNTIWLTETYILIFMLSVKIDWSLYRWSLDFYALYIYSSLLRIHNGFYSSRCVIKSLQNEFLMITFVYLNWKI